MSNDKFESNSPSPTKHQSAQSYSKGDKCGPSKPPAHDARAAHSPKAKTTKRKKMNASDHATAPSKTRPPSARTCGPSPYQLVSDSIDALCHEILLLEGKDPDSIAPFESYYIPMRNLDFWMELLDRDHDDKEEDEDADQENDGDDTEEGPILKDMGTRCRLLMAKLALDVCPRLAYPEVFVDTSKSQQIKSDLPPLIHLRAPQWKELRKEMCKLQVKMERGDGNMNYLFENLNCQMEAMEALAKLRKELLVAIMEINKETDGKKSASHFSYVGDHIKEYETSSDVIEGKLHNIHQTGYGDLFVPQQMLTLKRCTNIQRMKDSVTSLIEEIDVMITKKVFPLQNLQVQFSKLLRDWEKSCLSPPVLSRARPLYKFGRSPSLSPPRAAGAFAPVSPTTSVSSSRGHRKVAANMSRYGDERDSDNESESDSDDDHCIATDIQNKAKARASSRRARARKSDESYPENESESDSDGDQISTVAKSRDNARARSSPARSTGRKSGAASPPSMRHMPKKRQRITANQNKGLARASPSRAHTRERDKSHSDNESESDSEDDQFSTGAKIQRTAKYRSSPARSPGGKIGSNIPKKKQKRIPYSEEEKRALRKGLKRFPTLPGKRAKWGEIREYYDDVFKVNNRTNVNLKDLCRTMMKQESCED